MQIRRRKKQEPELSLTSMADIAFLLIVFFILTSSFMKDGNAKLKLPQDQLLVALEQNPVYVSIDETGAIWVQGKQTRLDEVQSKVTAALAGTGGAKPDKKDDLVLFRCDAKLPQSVYEPVIVAISEAGGTIGMLGDKAKK